MTSTTRFINPWLKQPLFLASAVLILLLTIFTYSGHFNNPFQFDDSHTIEYNMSIRDMGNLPSFFTDAATFSTNPANRAWRPGVTTLNAINTAMSGGVPKPFWFHVTIFAGFILLGVLIFFMMLHLLRQYFPEFKGLHWAALGATGLFWLHTANAETINYIISRSDAGSTLMIVAGLLLFMLSEKARKYYLFLIPFVLGFLIKEPAVMAVPILLVYVWLYGKGETSFRKNWVKLLVAMACMAVMFLISRVFTPATWTSGGGKWYEYLATQFFVIVHYFNTFFLPVNLSADTDWGLVTSLTDDRVFAGLFIIGVLLLLAWRCSKQPETRGVTFGLLWFFLALAPTSSVMPFAEVLNDHRTYFPYIGLIIALVSGVVFLLNKYEAHAKISLIRNGAFGVFALLLLLHAYGTRQRCEVWGSAETLWKDATEKSPGNGRAWMNYGLALLSRGDIAGAEVQFTEALRLSPFYSYANINMAIVKQRQGNTVMADTLYERALRYAPRDAESYNNYAWHLFNTGRSAKALQLTEAGLALSANHESLNNLYAILGKGNNTALTPEALLNQSLGLYNSGDFRGCVAAAQQAIKLRPDYSLAWNNVSAGYIKLGMFDSAAVAGEKAAQLDTSNAQAKGNLRLALQQKKLFADKTAALQQKPTHDGWIELSLDWFNAGNFPNSITAAEEALKLNANSFLAWNNICAANNRMRNWKAAVEAGENAVKLKPDMQLAKNNLAEARRGLASMK
ncbi:MAG: tetratricopeptide repeat protein [Bacteroidia bacterium]|jgi:Tfp pilus assembly protein PilF|nr:tetratricopeptide repeat protein [Bacteroidia bacterium]